MTAPAVTRPAPGLVRGDARRLPLASGSMHCVVTSVPYWGLRDYGVSGQIGLEATPAEYVREIVNVFRQVRRVLRADGTLWLNIGDCYVTKPIGSSSTFDPKYPGGRNRKEGLRANRSNRPGDLGLKHKDMVGMPWRVAFALQEDGWYLRRDIIWEKPNAMPESVEDRPSTSHEYLFLLSRSASYFYDIDAVREPNQPQSVSRAMYPGRSHPRGWHTDAVPISGGDQDELAPLNPAGRNSRSVWSVPTAAFPGGHFATFPPKLIEPCIRAGTSEAGCCAECGQQWERIVVRPRHLRSGKVLASKRDGGLTAEDGLERTGLSHFKYNEWLKANPPRTVGWHPACRCNAPPVPATVFDPFIGSGTTIVVANALGRHGIGLDLSQDYLAMAARRIARPHAPIPRRDDASPGPLFAKAMEGMT